MLHYDSKQCSCLMYIHAGETWFDVTCEFYLCLVWDFFEDGR